MPISLRDTRLGQRVGLRAGSIGDSGQGLQLLLSRLVSPTPACWLPTGILVMPQGPKPDQVPALTKLNFRGGRHNTKGPPKTEERPNATHPHGKESGVTQSTVE